jgi:pimeloyl-ACP methyl ester carboxylesterase
LTATQIAEKWITLSHGRTRYFETGRGDEPTICLHEVGFTAGGDDFLSNMEPLAIKGPVLAPDIVGWGMGDRLQQEYSFAYIVDFVREFQDALGIKRSNIIGQSMGGWIAGLFAYESPSRVNKLVLVCAGGITLAPGSGLVDFKPPTRDEIRSVLEGRIKVPGVNFEELSEQYYAKALVPGAQEAHVKILNHMSNPETRERYNLIRRLPHIEAPTLVVSGDHDSRLAGWKEHYRKIPNVRMEVIADAGHFVSVEKPDEFNRLVAAFLRS